MRRLVLAAVLWSILSWLTPLAAQRPISIGLGGGASMPAGAFGSGVNTGWHALGTLVVGVPMQPLGLRIDAAHNRFNTHNGSTMALADGQQSLTSATLNLTYRLPMTGSPLSPYLIAGLGGYHAACHRETRCSNSTRLGWNAGAGTKVMVLGLRTFVEGRYHSADRVGGEAEVIPITFGVTF